MIDIRSLREHPEEVIRRLELRGVKRSLVEQLLDLDALYRETAARRDTLRAELNELSKSVGELMKSGRRDEAQALREQSRALGDSLREVEESAERYGSERDALLLLIPNLPSPDAPIGEDETGNRVIRYWVPDRGYIEPREFVLPEFPEFKKVPHWQIGEETRILDLPRAAKISGSMFAMYRGDGARLLRALVNYALDSHSDAYEEIRPPTLVKEETMVATGHLPKFADEAYAIERDGLYAIPTAEVPLTSLARDEILAEAELPLRFTAYTSCYRREAGAAGADTRGLLRLHEFDKVEIMSYCRPEDAQSMFFELTARAERLIQGLGLTYRVLDLCTGDLGQSAARTFDLEVYSPGTGKWLECSSVSWCSDYQARRANVRYRPSDGGKPRLVHTLNGSALAWPRIIAALLETGRQPDGTVRLPDAIASYFGKSRLGNGN
jgi:seryl-tRNA synthetase